MILSNWFYSRDHAFNTGYNCVLYSRFNINLTDEGPEFTKLETASKVRMPIPKKDQNWILLVVREERSAL